MSKCAVVRRSAGPTPTKPTRRPGHLRACPSRSNLSGRPARHLVMRSAGIGWTRGPRIPGVRAAPSRREPSGWRPRPERSRTFRRALAEHSASCGPEVRAVFYKSHKITASWWKAQRRDRERVVARVPFDVCQSAQAPPPPPTLRADRTRLDVLLRTRPALPRRHPAKTVRADEAGDRKVAQ
jgi:hypothetical protein